MRSYSTHNFENTNDSLLENNKTTKWIKSEEDDSESLHQMQFLRITLEGIYKLFSAK